MFTKDRQPSGSDVFLDAIKTRRSYYGLSRHSTISDQKLVGIVNQAVLHTPSSFNSQTTRVLVLLGTEHRHLWREIVTPAVKAVAPESAWETTEKKLEGFYNAHGTVLLYEDSENVTRLTRDYPLYKNHFAQWSEHTNGMCTFVIWTALDQEGFGCNLQHYNPLIDARVSERHAVPKDWRLTGQLVFGVPVAPPKEKSFKPLGDRILVRGGEQGGK